MLQLAACQSDSVDGAPPRGAVRHVLSCAAQSPGHHAQPAWCAWPQLRAWVLETGINQSQQQARERIACEVSHDVRARGAALVIAHSVDWSYARITSLPGPLIIMGDVNLSHSAIMYVDRALHVEGSLDIRHTPLHTLAPHVTVGQDLLAQGAALQTLWAPLNVGRHVRLSHTAITSLPDGLQIRGDLQLNDTPLHALPHHLEVRGNLALGNCPITSLPDDIDVGGDVYAAGSSLGSIAVSLYVPSTSCYAHKTRTLDMRDTQITYDMQARMRLEQASNVVLLFGARYDDAHLSAPGVSAFVVDDYVAAFRSSLPAAPQYAAICLASWHLSTKATEHMHSFLRALHDVPCAKDGPLAARVLALFAQMQQDSALRVTLIKALQDSERAGDAVVAGARAAPDGDAMALLDVLETTASAHVEIPDAWAIAGAPCGGAADMHKQVLRAATSMSAKHYRLADVEQAERVLAAYPVAQATQDSSADADLQHAAGAALSAVGDPTRWALFLEAFAPYQKALRRRDIQTEGLRRYAADVIIDASTQQSLCPLTQASRLPRPGATGGA